MEKSINWSVEYLLRRRRLFEQDFLFGLELTLVALLETVFEEEAEDENAEEEEEEAFGEISDAVGCDLFTPAAATAVAAVVAGLLPE